MPGRLPRLTADELLRVLRRDGWFVSRQAGSHVVLRHPTKAGRVVVPVHSGTIVKLGTLAGILDDAGLTAEDVARLR
jgi:predicted RNA binding protein YcfA (HicA-like mRNA interferase family)